jgi:hypothetical protein
VSTVGIIQSNFLPWRGYFDFIREVDTFIILEDVQYTKRDWRNRNRLRSTDGRTQWLSVPVVAHRNTKIDEATIDHQQGWPGKTIGFLEHNYGKAPYFNKYFGEIKSILQSDVRLLADLNFQLIKAICGWLNIETELLRSSKLASAGVREAKLISLVKSVNGSKYLSGPAAKDYIIEDNWRDNHIELAYKNYDGYPVYSQIVEPFVPDVSIIDLLFMAGDDAPDFIWGKYRAA